MATKPPFRRPGDRLKRAAFRRELFDRQAGLCHLCGKPMELTQRGTSTKHFATFDHVIPKALGGRASRDNLRLAHGRCNSARNHAPLPDQISGK